MALTEKGKAIFSKLEDVAKKNHLKCYAIYIEGSRNRIYFKQIDDNDYLVEISTIDNFDIYKSIKTDINNIFEEFGAILYDECNYGKQTLGFQKRLTYFDKEKYNQLQIEKEKENDIVHSITNIGTQFNGNVATDGGNINTGSANSIDNSSSPQDSDKKWFQKAIVKELISFVFGMISTLLIQFILRLLGWNV